jgi:hypothetical protein
MNAASLPHVKMMRADSNESESASCLRCTRNSQTDELELHRSVQLHHESFCPKRCVDAGDAGDLHPRGTLIRTTTNIVTSSLNARPSPNACSAFAIAVHVSFAVAAVDAARSSRSLDSPNCSPARFNVFGNAVAVDHDAIAVVQQHVDAAIRRVGQNPGDRTG